MHKQYTFSMETLTDDKLLDFITETIEWSYDISEMWTGTLHEKLIDTQRDQLIKAVGENDMKKAYNYMCDLGQTLDYAEKAFKDADERE